MPTYSSTAGGPSHHAEADDMAFVVKDLQSLRAAVRRKQNREMQRLRGQRRTKRRGRRQNGIRTVKRLVSKHLHDCRVKRLVSEHLCLFPPH
ncbi:hypothetical protein C1H46_003068 [Malus baccata]|uniref:Uncharacterized protein n=1 Tax=Malus baccata TaxID=106549 RepID=A0A540NJW5_MALBA|nr:hypothetical protein C1H46_003068 [Malus baccata]